MATDRKQRRLSERIEARSFDHADVRDALDELTLDELTRAFGRPSVAVIHAKPTGHWTPGSGRPSLADDDSAVMQAIGRCLAFRIRRRLPAPLSFGGRLVHHDACDWCDYPEEQLLAACDWAIWVSRYVVAEIVFWRKGEEGLDRFVTYERAGRHDIYENPRWAAWWDLPRSERAHRMSLLTLGMGVGS